MATICTAYNPSEFQGQYYWDWQATKNQVSPDVPKGFPTSLVSSIAWKGEDVQRKESEWKFDLLEEDIAAIDAAVLGFEEKHENLSTISSSTFEMPAKLSYRLRQLSDQVYKGCGFQMIHGIDPSKYSPRQNVILYAGISAHVCPERGFVDVAAQRVIGHVVNVQRSDTGPETVAPAFSNIPLSFHTDNCEVLSFYYKEMPSEGGRPTLSSSWQVYNELAVIHPEVLNTLAKPWVLDSLKSYSLQPPRSVQFLSKLDAGNSPPVLFRFSRYPILGWQRKRSTQLPAPSQTQLEALDAVQFIAKKNAITLPVVQGDIIFINDMAMFHAREGFDDSGTNVRHLLKMYLRDPEQGWTVPQSLQEDFGRRYTSISNGSKKEIWDIHYEPGLEELSPVNG